MKRGNPIKTRLWAFALCLVLVGAMLLVVSINPFEVVLAYLGLLLVVILIGLMTNLWGGLVASAVAVFSIILINQLTGIYTRENRILNIGSELALFMMVGPLAGLLSGSIEGMHRNAAHMLARLEEQTVHDATFNTLKPNWSKLRLEEEILRAGRFERPLSVALFQVEPYPDKVSSRPDAQRAERLGALQALVRTAQSSTQSPAVISYLGNNYVLAILPEHTAGMANQYAEDVLAHAASAVYFPAERSGQPLSDKSLGKSLREWGRLRLGTASLDGPATTVETLLAAVKADLESHQGEHV